MYEFYGIVAIINTLSQYPHKHIPLNIMCPDLVFGKHGQASHRIHTHVGKVAKYLLVTVQSTLLPAICKDT